ncbi:MAG: hypothetical protein OEY22_00445 [Candidatus Bathyarchaeota archaeon]|nr:hypothetical protein [Candidatus Bathyarchaeota archaeon]MDH5787884.1 hypothetical protein [Candidatus Bathyarchaeota archaeon]
MPTRRMRVEVFDGNGNKYTVAFEGQITRERATRLLDLVELLGGMPSGSSNPGISSTITDNDYSKYEKVRMTIQKHFPIVWFYSKEVRSVYEQEFKEPINLSTIATYLSRMTSKGVLTKAGASNRLKYKMTPSASQTTLKQQVP